ncbi:MAG: tetratricopeptide repeat protein, partial [Deltaproteobacteria bacterium]|nr:tetratricopeptide repeat protein [Deltaproteobacteria bacterium]
ALNYLGYTYAELGTNLEEALDLIKKALAIKPESGQIIDSLGWVYYKMGETDKAVSELERAIKYIPDDPVVLEHLGDAYLKKGLKDKAVDFYEKSLKIDPKNTKLKEKTEKLKKGLKNGPSKK